MPGPPRTCAYCRARLRDGHYRCGRCGQWNVSTSRPTDPKGQVKVDADNTVLLSDVPDAEVPRVVTGPWDDNFGSPPGIPLGSVTLLGGAPGVGKSTITLQLASALASAPQWTDGRPCLLLGAEENARQVKDRASRLGLRLDRIRIVPLERIGDLDLDRALRRPLAGLIIDSVPGFTQDPEQGVEAVGRIKYECTRLDLAAILINHITKDGDQGGLMRLQHAGDITLTMTKDEGVELPLKLGPCPSPPGQPCRCKPDVVVREPRTLATEKSRYGPGVETYYAMTERGLVQVHGCEDDEEPAPKRAREEEREREREGEEAA